MRLNPQIDRFYLVNDEQIHIVWDTQGGRDVPFGFRDSQEALRFQAALEKIHHLRQEIKASAAKLCWAAEQSRLPEAEIELGLMQDHLKALQALYAALNLDPVTMRFTQPEAPKP
jgi:hypothetical protein